MTKACTKCGEVKPLEEFYKDARRSDGRMSQCRPCHYGTTKKWVKNNPHARRSIARKANLKRFYGITPEEYERMLTEQGDGCAICKSTDNNHPGREFFHVDHDHKTGKVRGLLCAHCNHALGKFQDSPEILRSAINYLEERS